MPATVVCISSAECLVDPAVSNDVAVIYFAIARTVPIPAERACQGGLPKNDMIPKDVHSLASYSS